MNQGGAQAVSVSVSEREAEYCREREIPLRVCSPAERLRHILSFRSSPHLYHATCALSGKQVVTVIPPESGYRVYDGVLGDQLNAEQYGKPYDFSRGFFEQLEELARAVPYYSRVGILNSNENCDYSQGVSWSRNCYLCFRTIKGEDCLYSRYIRTGRDIVDSTWCVESELAYDCGDITRCYDIAFSEHCQDCASSRFLSCCLGCTDCFCCYGLSHAQFCFENEQLTPERYREKVAALPLDSFAECQKWIGQMIALKGESPRTQFLDHCEDSTGNHIVRCSGARNCFFSFDGIDIEHCIGTERLSSSFFSVGIGTHSELLYCNEAVGGQAYDVRFSSNCMSSVQHLEYCMNCFHGCAHCFGCVGLRNASYSILNRTYGADEYHDLVKRIRKQMRQSGEYGEYLPKRLSPFAVNHSEGFDFLPIAQTDAIAAGYRWKADAPIEPTELTDMPDSLRDIGNDVLTKKFRCAATGRLYTVQAAELAFHRRMKLPLSPYSPLERLYVRGHLLNFSRWCE